MLIDGIYESTSLTENRIPRSDLDIVNKTRSNPLPWNGQFSPQLVEALIADSVTEGNTILDPFVGSGTVLLEAARANAKAIGVEINPAAYYLARIYEVINFDTEDRGAAIVEVDKWISELRGSIGPLFDESDNSTAHKTLVETMLDGRRSESGLSGTIKNAVIVLSDIDNKRFGIERIVKVWTKIRNLIQSLPFESDAISVIHGDARSIPIDSESIDTVITSPPYINVFNYHQNYRKSVESLGWDVLAVARAEIGANRKHRGNRLLTVIQYCIDMIEVLNEIARVCHPKSEVIMIVGRESNVRGIAFFGSTRKCVG